MEAWEEAYERDKEAVGRTSHEAWLAWMAEASEAKHLPRLDGSMTLVDPPEEWKKHFGPEPLQVRVCLDCGQYAGLHYPSRGQQHTDYYDAPHWYQRWEDLEPRQRQTVIDAVGGRERYRLGFLAGQRAAG